MRDVLAHGGLALAHTAVTHFGPGGQLPAASDDFDYEYILDWCVSAVCICLTIRANDWSRISSKPTAQSGALALALSTQAVQLRAADSLAVQHEVSD